MFFIRLIVFLKYLKSFGSDASEIEQFFDIEQAEAGIASIYARNVLVALEKVDYVAPIQLPDPYKSSKEMEEYIKLLNTEPPSLLAVFPNPSKDYVIIHYNMEMEKDGLVEIMDVNGILMRQLHVNRKQDQVTVNTLDWKSGLYVATLIIDGKSVESVKFTLVK